MKFSIFVKWICVQILSTQCDAFINYLNASDVSPPKVCIQKAINHLFSYDDTLSLILDNDICEDAIFEMNTTRPYISLNLNTVEGIQLEFEGHFIICPASAFSLNDTIRRIQNEAVRYYRRLGNLKILVITDMVDTSPIFSMFWWYGINNVIVLLYAQGISKLHMADRYSPENACGGTVKSIISQNCEEQLTFSFRNVIHQMNKCPITFMYGRKSFFTTENVYPAARYILQVIQELSNSRNATFQRATYNDPSEFVTKGMNRSNILIGWVTQKFDTRSTESKLARPTVTEPLIRVDILWLVPKAEQISDMNAFVKVFNYKVWIAVGVTLISVSLTWFLIISWNGRRFTFDNLGLAFINVWSLTICGCIANFPRSFALRITLLTYLIYVIHIQCALTSNMATILTTPRYGFQISNLEELAESGLPIYIMDSLKMSQFNLNNTSHKLYTRLQKQLRSFSVSEYTHVITGFIHYRNYAAIALNEDLRTMEKTLSQKIDVYQIPDNSITGAYTIRLGLSPDHYFIPTLNSLLIKLEESGIADKLKNEFQRESFPENVSMEENEKELTLPHLAFIFVFLGIGLSISCVVFCLELVVHKFL